MLPTARYFGRTYSIICDSEFISFQLYGLCVRLAVDGKGNFVNKVLDIEDLVTIGQKLK